MPSMGESLAEGTLTKWFKKVGDAVKRDETIFEISTDKVDSEVQAVSAGILAEILVKEGETVPVNAVVAHFVTRRDRIRCSSACASTEVAARTISFDSRLYFDQPTGKSDIR